MTVPLDDFQSLPCNIKHDNHELGFTLIEVVVALAILAVVAVVASQASSNYIRSVDNTKIRTFAHFVAQNTAAELKMNSKWPQGSQVTTVSSQGFDWQVTLTPLSVSDALAEGGNTGLQSSLLPIDIQVAPISRDSAQVQHSITNLTIMLYKPEE